MLETMHEDVNKVSKKPYVEMDSGRDRPDAAVAAEFWDGFCKREKSIFVDLFYG